MKKNLIILLLIFTSTITFVKAKIIYIKGTLPQGLKVSAFDPRPEKKCRILIKEVGTSDFIIAKTIAKNRNGFIAQSNLKLSGDYINIQIELQGHNKWSGDARIITINNKSILDIGTVKFIAVLTPKIKSVILTRHSATNCLNYQVRFNNPTSGNYSFVNMMVQIDIKYDFSVAGLSTNNTASLKYKLDDKLYLHPERKVVIKGTELINNPEYLVDFTGKIKFYRNKGIIRIILNVETDIDLPENGSNYIQFELPKLLKIVNTSEIIDDPMFDDTSFKLIEFKTSTLKQTIFKFKSTNHEIPSISFKKKH